MKFRDFVRKVLRTLNKSGIKYVIIGGVAAIFYGRPRTTLDLDLIVVLRKKDIGKFSELLQKNKFEVKKKIIEDALKKKNHASIFLKDSPYRIDLKGIYSSLDEASLARRNKFKIFGEDAWIESPEDVIIAKLVYGSQQDIEDVRAILLRHKRLNLKYLMKRGKDEEILEELKKIMKGVR